MESFEITLFLGRSFSTAKATKLVRKCIDQHLFWGKEVVLDVFNEKDRDFAEIRISIFNLIISKENLVNVIEELSNFVGRVFRNIADILFAAAVYELTCYFVGSIKTLKDFGLSFFSNFPLVFMRVKPAYTHGQRLYQFDNVFCTYHESAQALF